MMEVVVRPIGYSIITIFFAAATKNAFITRIHSKSHPISNHRCEPDDPEVYLYQVRQWWM